LLNVKLVVHGVTRRSERECCSLCVVTKAGDTLSSRHVSARDVTSAVEIFNIEFCRTLTFLSLCLCHVI
jgi:hypothetical protein